MNTSRNGDTATRSWFIGACRVAVFGVLVACGHSAGEAACLGRKWGRVVRVGTITCERPRTYVGGGLWGRGERSGEWRVAAQKHKVFDDLFGLSTFLIPRCARTSARAAHTVAVCVCACVCVCVCVCGCARDSCAHVQGCAASVAAGGARLARVHRGSASPRLEFRTLRPSWWWVGWVWVWVWVFLGGAALHIARVQRAADLCVILPTVVRTHPASNWHVGTATQSTVTCGPRWGISLEDQKSQSGIGRCSVN